MSNAMILKAVSQLANRMDNIETRLASIVDTKLLEFEEKLTDRLNVVNKESNSKLIQLEDSVEKRIVDLENDVWSAINTIEGSVTSMLKERYESRIDYLERQARLDELVVSGVPKLDNENLENISQDICKAIGYDGNNNIKSQFRLPVRNKRSNSDNSKQNNNQSVMLKFWSLDAKADFFKKYIAKKSLSITDIGFAGSTASRIYINENLTTKNFQLLREVRQLKAQKKLFQYNTFSGKIFVKFAPEARLIGIDSLDQLSSFIMENAAAHRQSEHKKLNKKRSPNKR